MVRIKYAASIETLDIRGAARAGIFSGVDKPIGAERRWNIGDLAEPGDRKRLRRSLDLQVRYNATVARFPGSRFRIPRAAADLAEQSTGEAGDTRLRQLVVPRRLG